MIGEMVELFAKGHKAKIQNIIKNEYDGQYNLNQRNLFFIYVLIYYKIYDLDYHKVFEFNKNQLNKINTNLIKKIICNISNEKFEINSFDEIFFNISDKLFNFAKSQLLLIIKNNKINLKNLEVKQYEHKWDKIYFAVLKNMIGLDFLCKKVTEIGIEPYIRINYTGSNIQVNKKVTPELYNLFEEACNILDIKTIPDFYIEQGFINAFTVGSTNPLVVIDSGALSTLTRDELLFIIGHELGHIKSEHCLYHMVGDTLPIISDIASPFTLGLSGLVSSGMRLALNNWKRMSEFTSDRAGLLCCQNINAALSVFMKLSGLPICYYRNVNQRIPGFIEQAEKFESLDSGFVNKLIRLTSIMNQDHPWMILRTKELLNWYKGDDYNNILNGVNVIENDTTNEENEEISNLSKFYNGFVDNVSSIGESIGNTVSNAGKSVMDAGDAVGEAVSNAGSAVAEFVSDKGNSALKSMEEMTEGIGNIFKRTKLW